MDDIYPYQVVITNAPSISPAHMTYAIKQMKRTLPNYCGLREIVDCIPQRDGKLTIYAIAMVKGIPATGPSKDYKPSSSPSSHADQRWHRTD